MSLLTIDQSKCKQDGICAAVCPAGVIEFSQGEFPRPAVDAEENCINCGHCVAVCPAEAMSHKNLAPAQCPPVQNDLRVSPEQCEQFLRSRRSIRVYRDKPVPRPEIQRLIEIARCAPTGHNSQCVKWLVIDDRQELHRLAGVVVQWMGWMIENMPQFAEPMHLARTVERWQAGIDVVLRGAPALVVTHAHQENRFAPFACPIALSYLELSASANGMGACWAGYFHAAAANFPPMQEALALPNNHQSFGAMMLGYPKFSYKRLPLRKKPPITWR